MKCVLIHSIHSSITSKKKHKQKKTRLKFKLKIDRVQQLSSNLALCVQSWLSIFPFFFPSVHNGISFLSPLSFRRCLSHPLMTCFPVISFVLPPSFFPRFSWFFSFSCTCPVLQVYDRSCSLFAVISKLCKSPCAIDSSSPFSFLPQSINTCSHSLTHLQKSLR